MIMVFAIVVVIIGFILRCFNTEKKSDKEADTVNVEDMEEQPIDTPSQLEQCRAILKELGFRVKDDDTSLLFSYERTYMLLSIDNEEHSLCIVVPHVWNISDSNEFTLLRVANRINTSIYPVKAHLIEDTLWLCSSHIIGHDEIISLDVIVRMIDSLGYARSIIEYLHKECFIN